MEKWKQEAEALKIVEAKAESGSTKVLEAVAGSGSKTSYLEAEAINSSCFRITDLNVMEKWTNIFSNGITACEMLLFIEYCCYFISPILLCFTLHLLFYALQKKKLKKLLNAF